MAAHQTHTGTPGPAAIVPVRRATSTAPVGTGLDGSWLLADAIRTPDLARRCRGSLSRLIIALLTGQPRTAEDRALAAYSILNGAVAVTLLAAAGFFWYRLFATWPPRWPAKARPAG